MGRELSILIVSHDTIAPDHGSGRATCGLIEELRRCGHRVDTFEQRDVFPTGMSRLDRYRPQHFARAAMAFAASRPRAYDVIDAFQGDLPQSKDLLGTRAVTIARSHGLYAFYREFAEFAHRRWPDLRLGTPIGRLLTWPAQRADARACRRSMESADHVVVVHEGEQRFVTTHLRSDNRCTAIPNGLWEEQARALSAAALPSEIRRECPHVVAVGAWSVRKGAGDWPKILARLSERIPHVRVTFLGTGIAADDVLRFFNAALRERIAVVAHYDPDELPSLLRAATVGAFPSYVEAGCSLAVLEQLAAGVPVVSYAYPGHDGVIDAVDPRLVVPLGDPDAFALRIAEFLKIGRARYEQLATRARAVAGSYRLDDMAARTIELYERCLHG